MAVDVEWEDTNVDTVAERFMLARQGITPKFVLDYEEAGVLDRSDMLALAHRRITPLEAKHFAQEGVSDPRDMMKLHKEKASGTFLAEMRKTFPGITVEDAVKLRKAGISKTSLAKLKKLGFTDAEQMAAVGKNNHYTSDMLQQIIASGGKVEDFFDADGKLLRINGAHIAINRWAPDLAEGEGEGRSRRSFWSYVYPTSEHSGRRTTGTAPFTEEDVKLARTYWEAGVSHQWVPNRDQMRRGAAVPPEEAALFERYGVPAHSHAQDVRLIRQVAELTGRSLEEVAAAQQQEEDGWSVLKHDQRYDRSFLPDPQYPNYPGDKEFLAALKADLVGTLRLLDAMNFGSSQKEWLRLFTLQRESNMDGLRRLDAAVRKAGVHARRWGQKTARKFYNNSMVDADKRAAWAWFEKMSSYGVLPDDYDVLLSMGIRPEDMAAVVAEAANMELGTAALIADDEIVEEDEHVERPEYEWDEEDESDD